MKTLLILATCCLIACHDPASDCPHQWQKWEDTELRNGFDRLPIQQRTCATCGAKHMRTVKVN